MIGIETVDIVKAYIDSIHGWAVADQFESSFLDNKATHKQNHNALEHIRDTVADLLDSDALSEEALEQLEEYNEYLSEYLEGDDNSEE